MSEPEQERQQFNVYLSRALVRSVKHAAIDEGQTLSAWVEAALRAHLERKGAASGDARAGRS